MDHLISYYQVRSSAWLGYAGIVWNRFNWLLTLQLGIIGYYFTVVSTNNLGVFSKYNIPTIGLIISLLWLFMGVEDFKSMKKHRSLVKELESKIESELLILKEPIGTDDFSKRQFHQTYLLFIFPIVSITNWCLVLVI
jgi:hypothetical protein